MHKIKLPMANTTYLLRIHQFSLYFAQVSKAFSLDLLCVF